MTYAGPYVHIAQQEDGQIYHSDSVVGNNGMDDLRDGQIYHSDCVVGNRK
jgi:hypothetical protein